jgi:dolichol kinase
MNRKSWAGVLAGFLCTLALNLWLVWVNELSSPWLVLAFVLAVVNPLVELVSPRGTDDFTMATTNALICLGFGTVLFG